MPYYGTFIAAARRRLDNPAPVAGVPAPIGLTVEELAQAMATTTTKISAIDLNLLRDVAKAVAEKAFDDKDHDVIFRNALLAYFGPRPADPRLVTANATEVDLMRAVARAALDFDDNRTSDRARKDLDDAIALLLDTEWRP